jgi:ABC-type multidrug transport system ATPase subunit
VDLQETFGLLGFLSFYLKLPLKLMKKILGVNGAGKTTTFDILSGIKFANAGSASIFDVNVVKSPPIGYCPQFDALPGELV